jgi:HAD superfamily hydrolase (TIGR01509 family)
MIRALIFDFDGVLVLSEKARFHVLQTMAMRHGLEIGNGLFKNIVGRTTKDFFKHNFPSLESNTLSNIIDDYESEYKDKIVDHVTPIAFTNDFIRQYSGDKVLAVTSGSDTRIIELLLTHLSLRDKISCVVGKEHVTKHKPDPQAYLFTAEQLELPPETCTVFEDTAVGAQAALKAGMHVYAVLNGLNSEADFDSLSVSGYVKDYEDLVNAATSDSSA